MMTKSACAAALNAIATTKTIEITRMSISRISQRRRPIFPAAFANGDREFFQPHRPGNSRSDGERYDDKKQNMITSLRRLAIGFACLE
jgi:hypothetical protein